MSAGPDLVSQNDLSAAFTSTGEEIGEFFGDLAAAAFVKGTAEQWSPAHHLDHLIRSNRWTAYAFSLPRPKLIERHQNTPTRSYSLIRSIYQLELSKGARAFGRYLPEPLGSQMEIVSIYKESIGLLNHHLAGYWTVAELDAWAMPHPALGVLSVREMVLFTLMHNRHHADGVRSRLTKVERQAATGDNSPS